MKAEQKFHLNRLAAMLVTPERFCPVAQSPEMRAWEESWNSVYAKPVDEPGDESQYTKLNSALGCPDGNPDCPAPDQPRGLGYHADCFVRTLNRDEPMATERQERALRYVGVEIDRTTTTMAEARALIREHFVKRAAQHRS